VHTDSSKQLLLGSASSGCHPTRVPGYKMSTSAVSDVGTFLPRPHRRRSGGSYGKMMGSEGAGSTPPASGLTEPPALPRYRSVPGAGLHQGTGAGLCPTLSVLAGRTEGTGMGHLPQASYSLSLCVCSCSVRNLARSLSLLM